MSSKIVDSQVACLGLWFDELRDHWVVLGEHHEGQDDHDRRRTCLTQVNQDESAAQDHETAHCLHDILVHLLPCHTLANFVL